MGDLFAELYYLFFKRIDGHTISDSVNSPAAEKKVGSQSEMCMSWFETLCGFFISGLHIAAAHLIAPSQGEFFIYSKIAVTINIPSKKQIFFIPTPLSG